MKEKDILVLIKKLDSSHWEERSEAISQLDEIKDAATLETIFKKINSKGESSSKQTVLDLIRRKLGSSNLEIGTIYFCTLYEYLDLDIAILKNQAKELINDFLRSANQFRYLKVGILRKCWRILPQKRKHITKSIAQFKIRELTVLILSNLIESSDEELTITTFDALINLNDKRGNILVKAKLPKYNDLVLEKALEFIGKLGNILDTTHISPYLEHDKEEIKTSAIYAYATLMGRFSIKRLGLIFNKTDSLEIKFAVLKSISQIQTRKAARFLLERVKKEKKAAILLKLNWFLHEFNQDILIKVMLKEFRKLSDQDKFKYLNFFSESYNQKVIPLLHLILKQNKNPIITSSTLEILSYYEDKTSLKIVEPFALDIDSPTSVYALNTYLNLNGAVPSRVTKTYMKLSLESHRAHHELIYGYLSKTSPNEKFFDDVTENYIVSGILSSIQSIRYMAVQASKSYPTPRVINYIVEKFSDPDYKESKGVIYEVVYSSLQRSGEYISWFYPLIKDLNNYRTLSEDFFDKEIMETILIESEKVGWESITPYLAGTYSRFEDALFEYWHWNNKWTVAILKYCLNRRKTLDPKMTFDLVTYYNITSLEVKRLFIELYPFVKEDFESYDLFFIDKLFNKELIDKEKRMVIIQNFLENLHE